MNEKQTWSENVILADADYVDKVAFNLIVNFERMLGRRIPQADMARWAECIALDGGLREKPAAAEGDTETAGQETHVVLVHDHRSDAMANFEPGSYAELNGKAFRGPLGEFTFTATSTEGLAPKDELFADTLQMLTAESGVKRLMVVPDETQYNKVREILRRASTQQAVTVFAMQPIAGGPFMQEILGYSLMAALGIRSDEIKPN